MYLNYNYQAPTTKEEMLSTLKDIEEFFKTRKDEIPETTLEKLSCTKMTVVSLTDEQLSEKADIMLAPDFEADFIGRKAVLTAKKEEYKIKRDALSDVKSAKIKSLESDYGKAVKKLRKEAVKRGMEYSGEVATGIADLTADLSVAKATAEGEYTEKYSEYTALISDCEAHIAGVKEYFSAVHAAKKNKLIAELKEKEDAAKTEALKYNNGLKEKEIRVNNGVTQSQAKLIIDYLAIKVTDLTEQELAVRGYFNYVMKAITDYYFNHYSDNVKAYQDFMKEASLITFLGSFYGNMLALFYQRAYPEKAPASSE